MCADKAELELDCIVHDAQAVRGRVMAIWTLCALGMTRWVSAIWWVVSAKREDTQPAASRS